MRIVLDTNVVISALIWGGTPYKLIEAAADGDLVLCTSNVSPAEAPAVVPGDPDDDHVIAAAVAAAADLLVSGDGHLLAIGQHLNIHIVTPAEAAARIGR